MITVGNITLIPKPTVNITPEYFYFGEDVIGGYVMVEIAGTHHASSEQEYESRIQSILNLIDTCINLNMESECGDSLETIDGSQGVVRDVRISHAGSSLDFNYTIMVECSKGSNKQPLITNQSSVPFAELMDNSSVVINSYSETLSSSVANSSSFSIDGKGNLVKNPGKLSIQIDVGCYDNDQCDSNNIDFSTMVSKFLITRAQALIDQPSLLKMGIAGFILCGINAKQTLRKTGGSISFEAYKIPGAEAKAIVEFSETQEVDQVSGFRSVKIKGSIIGIDSSKSILEPDNDGMINAKAVYNSIKGYYSGGISDIFSTECGDAEAYVPNLDGTCYILNNSRVSEFPSSNRIDFDLTYQDLETCELMGYKITTQYEERPSVKNRVEHLVPGRPKKFAPLVYYSRSTSAPKYKLTVQGDLLNTCAEHTVGGYSSGKNPVVETVKNAVKKEFSDKKSSFRLSSGNIMVVSRIENEGRYTYSITEEYIQCQ